MINLALVGSPVSHSLSPFIHATFAARLSLPVFYTAFDVEPDNFADALKGAATLGFTGLNVTYPHKTAAAELAFKLDETAAKIGAVNTLKRTAQGFSGYNTDVFGVRQALFHRNIDVSNKTAVILGAGAAGHAAVFALAENGCKKILVANRKENSAKSLANCIKKYYDIDIDICELDNFSKISGYLLISAIALDAAQVPTIGSFDVVFDMNYHRSAILQQATDNGADAFDGIEMLVYQAAAAFEIFTEHNVPQNITKEIITMLINNRP